MRRLLGALTLVAADRAGAQSALTLVRQPREVVDAPSLSLRGGVAIVRPAGTGDRFADDVARLYGEAYDTYRDPQRSTAVHITDALSRRHLGDQRAAAGPARRVLAGARRVRAPLAGR
jgi:hypothetical protein